MYFDSTTKLCRQTKFLLILVAIFEAIHTCISLSESWSVWFVVFLIIASLIWLLVNCSCSAVTSRLRLATLYDDSCVSDRSVLLNDDSAYDIVTFVKLSTVL